MTTNHHRQEAIQRGARMLRTALGPAIAQLLEDPAVVEVMLNPDGRLWVDRLSEGLSDTGERLSAADGERIVRLVAHHVGAEVHARSPRARPSCPRAGRGSRACCRPWSPPRPCHTQAGQHRVQPRRLCGGGHHVCRSGFEPTRGRFLPRQHPCRRRHLDRQDHADQRALGRSCQEGDRVVIIEDTRELQCAAPNLVALRTKDGVASLSDLVRSSLRLRPDRIPIGEVRGSEALDLLKAWGTGHPGGIGTIHAGTGIGALRRLNSSSKRLWSRSRAR